MFKGSFTALITPFKNKRLDRDAYAKLIHHQIDNGTNGLVPGGTTGESPTLSHVEHREILKFAFVSQKIEFLLWLAQDQIPQKKQFN